MSREVLGVEPEVAGRLARSSGAWGRPEPRASAGAWLTPVFASPGDLRARPPRRHPPTALLAGLALALLAALALAVPRLLHVQPDPTRSGVSARLEPVLADGVRVDQLAAALILRNDTDADLAPVSARLAGLGQASVAVPPGELLRAHARLTLPVLLTPSCRLVELNEPHLTLVVQDAAEGSGPVPGLRRQVSVGFPDPGALRSSLATVCPAQRPGLAVTAVGNQPSRYDGTATVLLVNNGTRSAEVVLLGVQDRFDAVVRSDPVTPIHLAPGEAVPLTLTYRFTRCPADATPPLQSATWMQARSASDRVDVAGLDGGDAPVAVAAAWNLCQAPDLASSGP